jgi:hypothetical protein
MEGDARRINVSSQKQTLVRYTINGERGDYKGEKKLVVYRFVYFFLFLFSILVCELNR